MANSLPSLLIFGPQTRPSPDDLAELRQELLHNPLLAKVCSGALDLPEFWKELVLLDSDLDQTLAGSHINAFAEWLRSNREAPYCALQCPITLTFLLNFLIQINQYLRFLRSIDGEGVPDAHSLMLGRLRQGGVHGFCVGFLCAITVSLSKSEVDIGGNAARLLPLALAIGVYVDKDATVEPTTCISARWRHKQANALDKALAVLKAYPEVKFPLLINFTRVNVLTKYAGLYRRHYG